MTTNMDDGGRGLVARHSRETDQQAMRKALSNELTRVLGPMDTKNKGRSEKGARRGRIKPQATVIRLDAGIGKTTATIDAIVQAVRADKNVVFALPEHKLAEEVRRDVQAELDEARLYGRTARIWFGQTRAGMCERPDDLRKMIDAKLSVRSLCYRTKYKEGYPQTFVECPLAEKCRMMEQREEHAAVWIVTHAMLSGLQELNFTQPRHYARLVERPIKKRPTYMSHERPYGASKSAPTYLKDGKPRYLQDGKLAYVHVPERDRKIVDLLIIDESPLTSFMPNCRHDGIEYTLDKLASPAGHLHLRFDGSAMDDAPNGVTLFSQALSHWCGSLNLSRGLHRLDIADFLANDALKKSLLNEVLLSQIEAERPNHTLRMDELADIIDSKKQGGATLLSSVLEHHEHAWKLALMSADGRGETLDARIDAIAPFTDHKVRIQLLQSMIEGRTIFAHEKRDGTRHLKCWIMKSVGPKWFNRNRGQCVVLDATAPRAAEYWDELFNGEALRHGTAQVPVNMRLDIRTQWPEAARVLQITGGPISVARRENAENQETMRSFLQTTCSGRGRVLAVAPAGHAKTLFPDDKGKPDNLEITSLGYIKGSNAWDDVDAVVFLAQPDPGPEEVERQARVIGAHFDVGPVELDEHGKSYVNIIFADGERHRQPVNANTGRRWWEQLPVSKMLRDCSLVDMQQSHHPVHLVRELRFQGVDAPITQAVNRARPVRRTDKQPLDIFILSNEALPEVPIDEVMHWRDVAKSIEYDQKLRTMGVFSNPKAMASATEWTPDKARYWWRDMQESRCHKRRSAYDNYYKEHATSDTETLPYHQAVEYATEGATRRSRFFYTVDSPFADDVHSYIATHAGEAITIFDDLTDDTDDICAVFTTPAMVMQANPLAYPSQNACKLSLSRNPVKCPEGWKPYNVRLSKGRTAKVYIDPSVSEDDARAYIEDVQGREVMEFVAAPNAASEKA